MRRSIAALVIVLHGCSFVFVSGPPANHQQLPAFDCTTSKVGPVLDTVWTVLQTLNFALAVGEDDQGWHDIYCKPGDTACSPPLSRGAAIPIYAALAALGGAGMYFGYTRVSQCTDAKAALMLRATTGPQPGTWPPPAAPAPPAPAPAPPGTIEPPPAVGHPPPLGPAPGAGSGAPPAQ